MASKRLAREYPHLSAYLDSPTPSVIVEGDWKLFLLAGTGVLGSILLIRSIADAIAISSSAAMGAILAAGGLAGAGYLLVQRRKSRREITPEDRLLERGHEAREAMRKADNERWLIKSYDPVALELLETGAKHWAEVGAAFHDQRWGGDLPDHWQSLRTRALAAADLCMAQLAILCGDCFSRQARTRKNDFEEVFEDLADFDIIDGLQKLTRVFREDSSKYKVKSPRTKEIFNEARALVEQLQDLAAESSAAAREARLDVANLDLGRESVRSVLEEMRFIRTAEAEIDSQHERS